MLMSDSSKVMRQGHPAYLLFLFAMLVMPAPNQSPVTDNKTAQSQVAFAPENGLPGIPSEALSNSD